MLCRLSASLPASLPAPTPPSPYTDPSHTAPTHRHTEIALTIASPTAWQRTRCAAQISYRIYSAARARAVASIYFCRLCVYNSAQRSVSQNRCDCGRSSRANDWTNERTNRGTNEQTNKGTSKQASARCVRLCAAIYTHKHTYIKSLCMCWKTRVWRLCTYIQWDLSGNVSSLRICVFCTSRSTVRGLTVVHCT